MTGSYSGPRKVTAELSFSARVIRLESVDSTNREVARLLERAVDVGTAVVALEQTEGRGQRGRTWFSPPGSLYLSISTASSDPRGVAFASALASARAIREVSGVKAMVRWPNDIVVLGRKLGGVLVESSPLSGVWIMGTGINVNVRDFPDALQETATSILLEAGRPCDLRALEDSLLVHQARAFSLLEDEGFEAVLAAWRVMDDTAGRLTRVGDRMAEAVGVDGQGHLVAKDGERFEVIAAASRISWSSESVATEQEE